MNANPLTVFGMTVFAFVCAMLAGFCMREFSALSDSEHSHAAGQFKVYAILFAAASIAGHAFTLTLFYFYLRA